MDDNAMRKPRTSVKDPGKNPGYRPRYLCLLLLVVFAVSSIAFLFYLCGIMFERTHVIYTIFDGNIDIQRFFAGEEVRKEASKQPHIIFIIADDLGFNDVGYHNPGMLTPNIDKLVKEGVRLENYYVQPICSPTRTQLMSGRYQIHFGMQHGIIWPAQPYCLPLDEVTMAQKMKEAGYSTHAIGKWHLGFYRKECTPLYRGFDSFYGFLSGGQDYNYHNFSQGFPSGATSNMPGYDFRRNEEVDYQASGQYSTILFGKEAQEVVSRHDPDTPLFMYLSFQAVHAPLEVPAKYLEPYSHILNEGRRIFSGMTTCMDEAIGNLTDSLKEKGMWENTLLVFTTDNGGQVWKSGNNYPLRGWKWSFWEGGIRGVGFVSGPLISRPGRQSWELMHVTDWFPTLVKVAGSDLNGTLPLDGVDQWDTINSGAPTERTEILHGIDPVEDWHYPVSNYTYCHQGIIRKGDWKLLVGCPGPGTWVKPPTTEDDNDTDEEEPITEKGLYLFNIRMDPEERYDLSDHFPEKVEELKLRLQYYNASALPVFYPPPDPKADPSLHNDSWGPWV